MIRPDFTQARAPGALLLASCLLLLASCQDSTTEPPATTTQPPGTTVAAPEPPGTTVVATTTQPPDDTVAAATTTQPPGATATTTEPPATTTTTEPPAAATTTTEPPGAAPHHLDDAAAEAPPPAPESLSVIPGVRILRLTWASPPNPDGVPIDGYLLQWKPSSTDGWDGPAVGSADVDGNWHDIAGLDDGTTYDLRLFSVNASGRSTVPLTAAATTHGVPAAPAAPALTAGARSLVAAWTPPQDGGAEIDGYVVEWSRAGAGWDARNRRVLGGAARGTTIDSIAAGASSTRLAVGTDYAVRVYARNSLGLSEPSPASVAAPTADVPGAPAMAGLAAGDGRLAASWTRPDADGGAPVTGYLLRWARTADGAADDATLTGAGSTSHTITGLLNGRAYEVRVRARNAAGWGPWSNTVEAAPVEPDTAPDFGEATVADMAWPRRAAVDGVALPEAAGGNGALAYSIAPDLPAGVSFDPATRRLAGTPGTVRSAAVYTYTVADSDDNTSPSDRDTLTFSIAVVAAADDGALVLDEALDWGAGVNRGSTMRYIRPADAPTHDVTFTTTVTGAGCGLLTPATWILPSENWQMRVQDQIVVTHDESRDNCRVVTATESADPRYDGLYVVWPVSPHADGS